MCIALCWEDLGSTWTGWLKLAGWRHLVAVECHCLWCNNLELSFNLSQRLFCKPVPLKCGKKLNISATNTRKLVAMYTANQLTGYDLYWTFYQERYFLILLSSLLRSLTSCHPGPLLALSSSSLSHAYQCALAPCLSSLSSTAEDSSFERASSNLAIIFANILRWSTVSPLLFISNARAFL